MLVKIQNVIEYQEIFIQNMKYYRKQIGISQEKLAEKCGCATPTIGSIECGRQYPSFELMIKISKALSIHPADLFLRDSSKAQNRELYSKHHELLTNCERLPEYQQKTVNQLVKALAESAPAYDTSR